MSYLVLTPNDPVLRILCEIIERRTPGLFPTEVELVEASRSAVLVTYALRETYDSLTWRLTIERGATKPVILASTVAPQPWLWPPRWDAARAPVLVDLADMQRLVDR